METIAQEAKRGLPWEPIESAPKDGTIILGVVVGFDARRKKPFEPGRAYWSSKFECWCDPSEKEEEGIWELTHWIPLQELPTEEK